MRKAELFRDILCASRNIDSVGCKTKADLLDVIKQHEMRNNVVDENDDDDDAASVNDQGAASDDGEEHLEDDVGPGPC